MLDKKDCSDIRINSANQLETKIRYKSAINNRLEWRSKQISLQT